MNWLTFFSYTGIGYAAYYFVVLLLDSRAPDGSAGEVEPTVLNFAEDYPPEKVLPEDVVPVLVSIEASSEPATVGLGGVSMQSFFELARTEALQYTRSVSF